MSDTGDHQRLRIAVLYGGRSPEHDVSIMSATNVMRALDPARYEAVPIFVTRDGVWLLGDVIAGALAVPAYGTQIAPIPGGRGRLLAIADDGALSELPPVDLIFPVLHGPHGEDGTVQGLAAVAQIPLVGCGMAGSVAAIDKDIAKRLLSEAGIPTAKGTVIRAGTVPSFQELAGELGVPLFIKPARQGSSVGVSKVASAADYEAALTEGFKHDTRLLAEEFIAGREIECAVLERVSGELTVSRAGEIAPAASHGFYSYDAKYIDADGAVVNVPADLPEAVETAIRDMAARAFTAVGCDGMARVDFFLKADGSFLINELNTIPGFTNISMYPKAMEASGIPGGTLIDLLVEHALARGAA